MTFCDSADDITMTCTAAYFLPLHKCTGDAGWESTMLYDSVSQVNLLPPDCHLVIIGGNCDLCVFVYFETPLYIAVQGLQWGAGVQGCTVAKYEVALCRNLISPGKPFTG